MRLIASVIIALSLFTIAKTNQNEEAEEDEDKNKSFYIEDGKFKEYTPSSTFIEKHRDNVEEQRKKDLQDRKDRLAKVAKWEEQDRKAKLKREKELAKKQKQEEQSKEVASKEVKEVKVEQETSRGSKGRSLGTFEATFYCGCKICNGKWVGSPTASGVMPQAGRTIAVDPNVIPLGSTVLVNGKQYTAEDTGSAIKGNIIDIFVGSHSEALSKGRQRVSVRIVD